MIAAADQAPHHEATRREADEQALRRLIAASRTLQEVGNELALVLETHKGARLPAREARALIERWNAAAEASSAARVGIWMDAL